MRMPFIAFAAMVLGVSAGSQWVRDACADRPSRNHDSGDDLIRPETLELYPTYSAVGIELPYSGDANGNASAKFVWRRQGEEAWRDGVDMTIDRKNRLIWASVWPLRAAQTVEIKITLADPDPLHEEIIERVTTRPMVLDNASGRVFYVSPAGDDANAGTPAAPWATIQRGSQELEPGDTLRLMSGVYHEGNLLRGCRGEAGKPIIITAAPEASPILDSSHELAAGTADWRRHAGDIFVIDFDAGDNGGGYVAQDGLRSFHYRSLDSLSADPHGANRAWYYDASKKKLYVRTGAETPPSNHRFNISRHAHGVYLEGSRHVVVKGLTIRNYGAACVRISGNADSNIIFGNRLHNAQGGVFIKDARAANHAIWRNHIYEPGLADFGWDAIKQSEYGRQGVMAWGAGRGNSICLNTIHGWFDGINVEAWKKGEQFELNRDSDTMFNTIYNIADDAIENDGGGVNMRVHGNRIRNAHTALSFAPIERGPVYVTRNEATYHTLLFKLSVSTPSPGHGYFYHNSGYTIENANNATMIRFNAYSVEDQNKVFKNNAMVGSEWSVHRGRPNNILDGNCYYHTPAVNAFRKFDWAQEVHTDFDSFRRASGQEANGMYRDPRFVSTPDLAAYPLGGFPPHADASTGDLRLRQDSPCRDAGVRVRGVNDSFSGKAPDIGAFEYRR